MSLQVDKSNIYTGVGVGASSVGSLVSILAFALPYWIYYDEDLTLTDGTGSHQVQWTYHHGFWKFCNKVSSDVSNSDKCGSVGSHSDVEQTTACLLLLAILLFVSGDANGCLYLTIFKKEKLCLYITWISMVVAGVLAVTSIAIYAQADHSVTVSSDIAFKFSSSKLHASFWLVVAACLLVAIATLFITLAIINVHRTDDRPDDKNSMISYGSLHKSPPDSYGIPEEFDYINSEIPEAFPYKDSPFSTSSESLSEFEESFDSDDSDIDPKFAKLKVKATTKQQERRPVEDETLETRRCKSGEPYTTVRFEGNPTPKLPGSSIYRSLSTSSLTPIERTESQADNDALAKNQIYADDFGDLEQGRAPVATNLNYAAPAYDRDDAFILRRAKTEMPFTQRMKATIGRKLKEDNDTQVRAPAQIETDTKKASLSLQQKAQSFPRKPQKSKQRRKRRKPTEQQLKRLHEVTKVYSASQPAEVIYPPQKSQKSAPWNSARSKLMLRPKTSTLLKWSLHAYGVESIPKLPKHFKLQKKNGTESITLEDTEINEKNSSNA